MRRKSPESAFRALLPMGLLFYGLGMIAAAQDLLWVPLMALGAGTCIIGFGIYVDYSDAKRKARGRY